MDTEDGASLLACLPRQKQNDIMCAKNWIWIEGLEAIKGDAAFNSIIEEAKKLLGIAEMMAPYEAANFFLSTDKIDKFVSHCKRLN